MIYTIIIALIMFAVLIAVHEFGHFAAAKAVGIRVYEFAIGMGPVIFSRKKGDTQYSLRAFPIGGYVSMEGEDDVPDLNSKTSFINKSIPQRMIVVTAGVIMNFITAILLMILLSFMAGVPTNTILETVPDSPAAIHLGAGDKIVEMDQTPVESWEQITAAISNCTDGEITLGVVKAGETAVTQIDVEVKVNESGSNYIGIYPVKKKDAVYAVRTGFVETFTLCGAMVKALGMLFTGDVGIDEVVGPVGIVNVVGDAAAAGSTYLIFLTALISLNLGLVNILPFPALDGGRLLFMIIALIKRSPVKPETEMKWHYAGFLLLMGLTIFITLKDINQFILHIF